MIKTLPLLLAAAFLVLTQPTPADAVDFFEIVERQAAEQKQIQHQHGMRIEHFDQWIFSNQQKIDGAKKQLLTRLESEASLIQSVCQLDDAQKEKLLLAGRGDIQAFVQQYDEIRANFANHIDNQKAMQNIWQEIQPLQRKYHGQIYGEDSFFTKVLHHSLDEPQLAFMKKLRLEQRAFQYRATVMQLISQFERAAPLTHAKREKLLALIVQHTSPSKSTPNQQNVNVSMPLYFILMQMSDIPEDELRPLFEESAWTLLQKQMKQGKAWKQHLATQGFVLEKD